MKWAWLGRIEYGSAMELMERTAVAVQAGHEVGRILFLEHPPTVTLGRRGTLDALKVSPKHLASLGIRLERADRGGEATYHGPGQIITYPVVNLRRLAVGVEKYVNGLLETIRMTLATWGIKNTWNRPDRPGVWTQAGKIASIGLRVRNVMATHGFSLNLNVNKDHFNMIVPCGMEGTMTAGVSDFVEPPSMPEAAAELALSFGKVFGQALQRENPETVVNDIQAA